MSPVVIKGVLPTPVNSQPEPIPVSDPLSDPALSQRPPTNPASALPWMNDRHAVVQEGGKTRVITETYDPDLNRRLIVRSSFTDLQNFYSNRGVFIPEGDGKERREGLAQWWLTHPSRRQFRGVTFAPNRETPGLFNLWQGFGVVPAPGDWSLTKAHIAETICAGVADALRWLLAWMAAAVQHPNHPAEVAVVLRGAGQRQGCRLGSADFRGAIRPRQPRDHLLGTSTPTCKMRLPCSPTSVPGW